MSLKASYKMKLQGSENLQTVLALYNQELSRNGVPPRYQMIRIKSHKVRQSALNVKWENAVIGEQMDIVFKECQSRGSTKRQAQLRTKSTNVFPCVKSVDTA